MKVKANIKCLSKVLAWYGNSTMANSFKAPQHSFCNSIILMYVKMRPESNTQSFKKWSDPVCTAQFETWTWLEPTQMQRRFITYQDLQTFTYSMLLFHWHNELCRTWTNVFLVQIKRPIPELYSCCHDSRAKSHHCNLIGWNVVMRTNALEKTPLFIFFAQNKKNSIRNTI